MTSEIVAPWLILGPSLEGRDYGLLTHSREFDRIGEGRVAKLIQDYALTTLRATRIERQYLAFFPLLETGRWLLAATHYLGPAKYGPVYSTIALLLTEDQARQAAPHLPELFQLFPAPQLYPAENPTTLRWRPPDTPPDRPGGLVATVDHEMSLSSIAVAVPASDRAPPEDVALAALALHADRYGNLQSCFTRAELPFVGDLVATKPPRLIIFTDKDPPVSGDRFAGYHKLRVMPDGEIRGARTSGETWMWWQLEVLARIDRRILGELNAIDSKPGDTRRGAVTRARLEGLYRAWDRPDDLQLLRRDTLRALASAATQMPAGERIPAAEAICAAFRETPVTEPLSAAKRIEHFKDDMRQHLQSLDPGIADDSFLARQALEWNAVLMLSTDVAKDLGEVLLDSMAEDFEQALGRLPSQKPTVEIFAKSLAKRLSGASEKRHFDLGLGLLERLLASEDRNLSQQVVALADAVAKYDSWANLPRLLVLFQRGGAWVRKSENILAGRLLDDIQRLEGEQTLSDEDEVDLLLASATLVLEHV